MAIGNTGLLGSASVAGTTSAWTKIYTCPGSTSAAIEVIFNAAGAALTDYSWAISAQTSTPAASEVRESASALFPRSPSIVTTSIGPGQSVFVQSAGGGLNCIVNGLEETH